MDHPIKDPYTNCEAGQCNHDLAPAVMIDDLLADDGPFPPSHMIVNLASAGRRCSTTWKSRWKIRWRFAGLPRR